MKLRLRPLRGLFVAGALALGGCSLEPTYQRPELPTATAFPGAPAPRNEAPVAADIGWRNVFTDPRLQRLIELALKNNRDLRIAVANVETTRGQYGVERSALFPTLSANGAAVRGRGSIAQFEPGTTVGEAFEADAQVSWELDFFGRVRSLTKAALEQFYASAQGRKTAQLLLVSEVANQYLTVLAADESLKVTQESLRIAQESYRITKLMFDTGTGSELDLRESEGVYEQSRAQLAAEQRARVQAENALILLVGAPLPADLPEGLTLDQQNLATDIPAGLPSDLLTRRPDVVQAEDQLIAYNADLGAARAAFFPSISLTGALGTVSPVLRHLFSAGTSAWDVAPAASVPIFAGGLNVSNLAVAKAERDSAVAQYEKVIQTAFREVSDGLTARSTYDDQVASLDRQVKAQSRRLELADLRYKTGVDSYLTLLIAQTDLNSAQLTRVNVALARLNNLVTLYQSLGGGWIEHTGDTPADPRQS